MRPRVAAHAAVSDDHLRLPDPHNWRTQAACRDHPTAIFYPDQGANATAAKQVCDGCPVATQCAADGAQEPYGVWGGRSPKERGNRHSRGQAQRLTDVRACVRCDARVWTERNVPHRGYVCPACRDEEAVA